MQKINYTTIKIPEGLVEMIDKVVIESKGNFTSRTDVIKYAVRKYIEEEKRNEKPNERSQPNSSVSSVAGIRLAGNEASSERTIETSANDDSDKSKDSGNGGNSIA